MITSSVNSHEEVTKQPIFQLSLHLHICVLSRHCVDLFMDFVAIFRKLLIILAMNEKVCGAHCHVSCPCIEWLTHGFIFLWILFFVGQEEGKEVTINIYELNTCCHISSFFVNLIFFVYWLHFMWFVIVLILHWNNYWSSNMYTFECRFWKNYISSNLFTGLVYLPIWGTI